MKRLQQLGPYQLLDRIALGGMAEIYRARTIDLHGVERIVALKKVLTHHSEDDEFIQMLLDEAEIASFLDHPNIAQIYEFNREQNQYFIAMELVEGKDLKSLIETRRSKESPLAVPHAVLIAISVLKGLQIAHTCCDQSGRFLQIIHRDISPANILLTYEGHIKLIDFGIAKAVMSRVRTQTGVIKGKVKYMSPEQAMGQDLDARSDIFSLGSVLYEALTNQPPFIAANELALIFKVRDAEVTPPSYRNPEIEEELDQIVLKAMARTRSTRYQSSEEFSQDLERYLYTSYPHYSPKNLATLLQETFSQEIKEEQQTLENFLALARAQSSLPSGKGNRLTARKLPVFDVLREKARATIIPPPLKTQSEIEILDEEELFVDDDALDTVRMDPPSFMPDGVLANEFEAESASAPTQDPLFLDADEKIFVDTLDEEKRPTPVLPQSRAERPTIPLESKHHDKNSKRKTPPTKISRGKRKKE